MKKKIVTAVILAALTLMNIGCSKAEGDTDKPADTVTLDNGARVVEPDTDSMKKEAVDALNSIASSEWGDSFTIASTSDFVYVPESNETYYDAALSQRNEMFEKKFSTTLVQFYEGIETMLESAYLDLLAGIDYTDVFSVKSSEISAFASKGLLLRLSSVEGLKLDADYFDSQSIAQASYSSENYALYGAFNTDIDSCYCLYVNRDILAASGMKMPYQSVVDGSWTWSKLLELVKGCSFDGEAAMASSDTNSLVKTAYKSSGSTFVYTDYKKTPVMSYNNDIAAQTLDILRDLCSSAKSVYDASSETGSAISDFMQGKALFYIGKIGDMEKITTMEPDFCILPLPKTNEAQESYYTYASSDHPAILIFAGTKTENLADTISGLYAASTGGYLTQGYYKKLINTSIRDSYALDMLDYICGVKDGSYSVDFVDIYGSEYWDLPTLTVTALTSGLYDKTLTPSNIYDARKDEFNSYIADKFSG